VTTLVWASEKTLEVPSPNPVTEIGGILNLQTGQQKVPRTFQCPQAYFLKGKRHSIYCCWNELPWVRDYYSKSNYKL